MSSDCATSSSPDMISSASISWSTRHDGPLPRVVVDELRSEISPYFVLLTVLTAGTVEVLFDMGGLS